MAAQVRGMTILREDSTLLEGLALSVQTKGCQRELSGMFSTSA